MLPAKVIDSLLVNPEQFVSVRLEMIASHVFFDRSARNRYCQPNPCRRSYKHILWYKKNRLCQPHQSLHYQAGSNDKPGVVPGPMVFAESP